MRWRKQRTSCCVAERIRSSFILNDNIVPMQYKSKYPVVTIDNHLHASKHIGAVCRKACTTAVSLKVMYLGMNRLSQAKRALLPTVTQSLVLYSITIRGHATKYKNYAAELNTFQIKLTMGIGRAYRTIWLSMRLILANIPSLIYWRMRECS